MKIRLGGFDYSIDLSKVVNIECESGSSDTNRNEGKNISSGFDRVKNKVASNLTENLNKIRSEKNYDSGSANNLLTGLSPSPYTSPELHEAIVGNKEAYFMNDIWSMGIVIYALLTGELPFVSDNTGQMLQQIKEDVGNNLQSNQAGKESTIFIKNKSRNMLKKKGRLSRKQILSLAPPSSRF